MDSARFLPAVFMFIVGAMYIILVAFAVPALKRLDRNVKNIKRAMNHFTALSIIVFFDIAYNGYILYTLSGGKPISQVHILAKLFPSIGYLQWAWTFSTLSVVYIIAFASGLLYLALLMHLSKRFGELNAWKEENNKKLRMLQEKREQKLSELEKKTAVLKQLKDEFLADFEKSRAEIREKTQLIIEKEKRTRSGVVCSEIKRMLDPGIELQEPDASPFEEYITRAEQIEGIEGIPKDLLETIREYRTCLETINKKFKAFMDAYGEVKREKELIFAGQKELKSEVYRLEEENNELDEKINGLQKTCTFGSMVEEIKHLLGKSLLTWMGKNKFSSESSPDEI